MSTPTITRRIPPRGRNASALHRNSHASLLRDASNRPAPPGQSGRGRLDALVVPTNRPTFAHAGIVELAARMGTPLVVLCSGRAGVDQVTERIARTPRARALVVGIGDDCPRRLYELETSDLRFAGASANRRSDLSCKRNLGLLLARAMGWQKIAFVDDDITLTRTHVARIAHQLDNFQIAAMACREFPDNSVYCHARRLAKLPQDVFVSGAVLGVNCGSRHPLPFFPDIYNEDWFFFGEAAARHQLTKVGEAVQKAYDPFGHPDRAAVEEFGDLLAEGLYALIQDVGPGNTFQQVTHRANELYWKRFIEDRIGKLAELQERLDRFLGRGDCGDGVIAARHSLSAAGDQYGPELITAELCVDFLEAWQRDINKVWRDAYSAVSFRGIARDAMSVLGLTRWEAVRWPHGH
jgi:hypothetical protein